MVCRHACGTMWASLEPKKVCCMLVVVAALNGVRALWHRNRELQQVINKWRAAPFGFIGGIFTALFATGGVFMPHILD